MDKFEEFVKRNDVPISQKSLYNRKEVFNFKSDDEIIEFVEKLLKEISSISDSDKEILNSLLVSIIYYVLALTENNSDNNLQSCLEVIEANIKYTQNDPTSCFYGVMVNQFLEDHPARGIFSIIEKRLSNEEINSYLKKLGNLLESITA